MKNKTLYNLIIKVMIVVLPYAMYYALVAFILYNAEELISIDHLIDKQVTTSDKYLFGLAYSNPVMYYKSQSTIKRRPVVLALGTSRIMQIRDYFFYKSKDFYNAGGGIITIQHIVPFLEQLKTSNPHMLVISLDQYFFNDNWLNKDGNKFDIKSYTNLLNSKPTDFNIINGAKFSLIEDFVNNRFTIKQLVNCGNEKHIGFSAKIKNDGFRNDGSYKYGYRMSYAEKMPDFGFHDTFRRIEAGIERFEYGESVADSALGELDKILDYCSKHKIHVIAFLPPFAPSVIAKMKEKGIKYRYLWKISDKVDPIFKKYSIKYYDFTDMSSYGSRDNEFIDGFHGSEITYAKLFVEMSKHDSLLRKYVNLEKLHGLLMHPISDTLLTSESN